MVSTVQMPQTKYAPLQTDYTPLQNIQSGYTGKQKLNIHLQNFTHSASTVSSGGTRLLKEEGGMEAQEIFWWTRYM